MPQRQREKAWHVPREPGIWEGLLFQGSDGDARAGPTEVSGPMSGE